MLNFQSRIILIFDWTSPRHLENKFSPSMEWSSASTATAHGSRLMVPALLAQTQIWFIRIPNLNQRRALRGLQKSLSQNWFHQKLTQNSPISKTHLYKKATRVRNLFSDVGRSKVAPLRWKFTRNELRSVLAVKEVMQLNLFAKYAENTRVSLIWENRQLLWSFSNYKFQDFSDLQQRIYIFREQFLLLRDLFNWFQDIKNWIRGNKKIGGIYWLAGWGAVPISNNPSPPSLALEGVTVALLPISLKGGHRVGRCLLGSDSISGKSEWKMC